MDGKRAVVTLHPYSFSEPIPYRSLTFTSDSEHVEIGRASKREAKNLAPTDKNGLFDSRVMSRNHAKIRACLDKKIVFISDGGSMHGTRLNGKKLCVNQEVSIKTGDQVVFGTEVTRGRDTYPPLSVRCECQWFGFEENKPASSSNADRPKIATNTFCVPDDDDDDDDDDDNDVQVIGKPAPVVSTVESSSGSEEDSDDGSVIEVCSPSNIPSKDIDGEVRGGSQHTPIEIDNEQNDQPLATPRMTPSSNDDAITDADGEARDRLDESGDTERHLIDYSEDEFSADDLASQSDDDDSESDEGSISDSSFESDIELSDADGYSVTVHIPSFPESRKLSHADDSSGKKENAISHSNSKGEHVPGKKADGTGELLSNNSHVDGNVELPEIRGDARNSNPQTVLEPVLEPAVTPKLNPSAWSSSHQLYANSHLHLQPYGKIFDHSLTGFHSNSYGGGFHEWPSRSSLPLNYQYGQPRNVLGMSDLPLSEAYRPASSYYRDGPFARQPIIPGVAGELGSRPEYDTNPVAPDTIGNGNISNYYGDERNTHSRPDTRLRISDIVSLPQPPTQRTCRKRKVADLEGNSPLDFPQSLLHDTSNFEYNASHENQHVGVELEEPSHPDAQPQLDPSGMEEDPYTQLTTIDATKAAPSLGDLASSEPQNERPSKRAKTSEASKIGSHAATAVVSAMLGAVGTVALLASLPSDYFI